MKHNNCKKLTLGSTISENVYFSHLRIKFKMRKEDKFKESKIGGKWRELYLNNNKKVKKKKAK